MLPTSKSARPALLLLLAVLGAGCSGESPPAASAPPPATTPAKPPGASDFTAAVAMGAPVEGLKLQFRLASAPRVGVPATVELKLTATEGFQKGELRFQSDEGLRLADAAKQGTALAALAAGGEQLLGIELVPQAEGVYLLQATLDAEGLGGSRKGTWGIPVMVTAPPVEAASAPAPPPPPAGG